VYKKKITRFWKFVSPKTKTDFYVHRTTKRRQRTEPRLIFRGADLQNTPSPRYTVTCSKSTGGTLFSGKHKYPFTRTVETRNLLRNVVAPPRARNRTGGSNTALPFFEAPRNSRWTYWFQESCSDVLSLISRTSWNLRPRLITAIVSRGRHRKKSHGARSGEQRNGERERKGRGNPLEFRFSAETTRTERTKCADAALPPWWRKNNDNTVWWPLSVGLSSLSVVLVKHVVWFAYRSPLWHTISGRTIFLRNELAVLFSALETISFSVVKTERVSSSVYNSMSKQT